MSAGLEDVADNTPQLDHRPFSDPNRLAPEDAFFAHSPPRRHREISLDGVSATTVVGERLGASRGGVSARRRREKERGRSGSRRRKGTWKKLLWVKQNYPDNYTDPPTFLSHLQRNPRLLPYDFWPLVADSTVIVQHVCSVAIFVCCFAGIIQEQISPVSVVGWGSACTVLGWVFWDFWVGQEEAARSLYETIYTHQNWDAGPGQDGSSIGSTLGTANSGTQSQPQGLGLTLGTNGYSTRNHSRNLSTSSLHTVSSVGSPIATANASGAPQSGNYNFHTPYNAPASLFSPRNQQRLATMKSAILIYSALLAGAGLGAVLIGLGVRNVILGVGIWGVGTVLAMGGCSWWLIGLQKYKNVVIGPWDPARPIIRGGGWD
ncbi:hypothetical protein MMC34_004859 [Xylographa carneopallida]|nr:hypothetical protein [Xylographa carneopallida]